jgi:xanthine dehydrogenase accessory factor
VHAVIETQRGHDLGRVIWQGAASPNTGVPGRVGGEDEKRVLRAPGSGVFRSVRQICEQVDGNDIVAYVGDTPVTARISGVLRGIMHDGVEVAAGAKVGDVDPRGVLQSCMTVSDKALAIGGGVLEALLHLGVLP